MKPITEEKQKFVILEKASAARLVNTNGYKAWAAFPVGTRPIRSPKDEGLDPVVNKLMDEVWAEIHKHTKMIEPKLVVKADIPVKGFTRTRRGKLEIVKPSRRKIQGSEISEFIISRKLPEHFTVEANKIGSTITREQALDIWNQYKLITAKDLNDAYYKQYLREIVEAYLGMSGYLSLENSEIEQKLDEEFDEVSIEISELKKKYNLNTIENIGYDTPVEEAIDYLSKELEKIDKYLKIDGEGVLNIQIGEIDPEEGALAEYIEDTKTMVLDKKFTNTLVHEYAHFVFDEKLNVLKDSIELFPGLSDDMTLRGLPNWMKLHFGSYLKQQKEYVTEWGEESSKQQDLAFLELIDNLSKFYIENSDAFGALPWWRTPDSIKREKGFLYVMNPNEIFARAIQWYITDQHAAATEILEKNDFYHQIVREWGDKYLRTEIVKSQVKGHWRTRGGKRFYVNPFQTKHEKKVVTKKEETGPTLKDFQIKTLEYAKETGKLTDSRLQYLSNKYHIPIDEIKRLSKKIAEKPLAIRRWLEVGSVSLKNVFETGELKNQFTVYAEMGKATSSGQLSPKKGGSRDNWEGKISNGNLQSTETYNSVNYDDPLPVEDAKARPIYGYIYEDDWSGNVSQYGDIIFILKENVKKRASCSDRNSSTFYNPDSDIKEGFGVSEEGYNYHLVKNYLSHGYLSIDGEEEYTEAQIYGGINLASDIENIIIPKSSKQYEAIHNLAKKYNIPMKGV